MITYSQYRPTACDTAGLGCDGQQDWLVAPVGVNRDSDCLSRSNWTVVTEDILKADTGEDTEIHRFGHWACGWFEIMLVRPDTAAAKCAEEWENALEGYPVASDDHFSELEWNEACEYWARCSIRERVSYLQRARLNVMAARRDTLPEDPQGALLGLLSC